MTTIEIMNEILSAVPVIISLVIIEGLLSVDNALAIAAIASGLPENQRIKALRYGIVGAYVMRGLCLFFAVWIASNPWLKLIGAVYLIYLAVNELSREREVTLSPRKYHGFWVTIGYIEVMDLTLSMDNVVAAAALDRRLWVVCTGVFIGIAALRFVAGFCIRLIELHPILKTTAFLLVGFVGLLLLAECYFGHVPSVLKFGGIFAIVTISLIYEQCKTR